MGKGGMGRARHTRWGRCHHVRSPLTISPKILYYTYIYIYTERERDCKLRYWTFSKKSSLNHMGFKGNKHGCYIWEKKKKCPVLRCYR